MFSKILVANSGGAVCRLTRYAGRTGIATAVALATLAAPSPGSAQTGRRSAADPALSAQRVASAFRDVCLRAQFDAKAAQSALERLGWARGRGRTDSGEGYDFTHWEFPVGQVQVGYNTIAGVSLKTFSCTLVIKGPAAPPRTEIEAALESVLAPARFRDARSPPGDFARVAPIIDRDDEQELVGLWGNKVPLRVPGTVVLGPGIAIDYGRSKGPSAKELKGR